MSFQKIGFIGLGLIGGSIAKKIKQNNPNVCIYATAQREETIQEAYAQGILENDAKLPLSNFSEMDYIFLCAPVQKNLEYLEELKPIISNDCIITDVGSTKSDIHTKIKELDMEANFIGGHPMTGSEKTGITNADELLLENAYYIITPTPKTPNYVIDEFYTFVKSLGSIPLILDSTTHDYSTAAISHLPHMIAYTLVNLVKECDNDEETMKTIAAGGFKDITRIASSSPVMWQNICFSNSKQLLRLLDLYIQKLQILEQDIKNLDQTALLETFQSAKDYRDSIAVPGVKSQTMVFEIYMDLKDETGGIATIATLLAKNNINIKNIGIINNREFEEGVLRIEFYDEHAKASAEHLLRDKNYILHIR